MKPAFSAFLAALAFCLLCRIAVAQERGDFDPFKTVDLSAPGSVNIVADPTGTAPDKKVYSFALREAYCSKVRYGNSNDSDCAFGSSRSQMLEDVSATKKNGNVQPKQAWYGWSVYYPEDFLYGKKQTSGFYQFAYWHNGQCQHLTFSNVSGSDDTLYLSTSRKMGKKSFECSPGPRVRVADFKDLVGKWNRFEVFVNWANDDSGEVKVYLNGKYVVHYRGPNLTEGFELKNYFVFGVYLCCTLDVKKIKGTSLLYANVKRATTREALTGVAKGTFEGSKNDVALLTFPDEKAPKASGLLTAKYVVRSVESLSMKSGKDSQVNTSFVSRVRKHPKVKSFDFSMLGAFDFRNKTFYELELYFHDELKDTKALSACGSRSVLTFPDGSKHAWVHFKSAGNAFSALQADCIIKAVPPKLGNALAFLLDNFGDVAVGMAKDGTINLLGHEGLRDFMNRVAIGEVTVGR
jgi:Polysaccharide lyase